MKNYWILLLLIVTVIACSPTEESTVNVENNNMENTVPAGYSSVNISDKGMPLQILLPEKSLTEAEIAFNSNFGRMEVSCGDQFNYFITEEKVEMETKKNEIESGIFTINYLKDEPGLIIYESKLPDGSSKYYHFYAIENHEERTYLIEDNPLREFRLEEVESMALSASEIKLIENLTDIK